MHVAQLGDRERERERWTNGWCWCNVVERRHEIEKRKKKHKETIFGAVFCCFSAFILCDKRLAFNWDGKWDSEWLKKYVDRDLGWFDHIIIQINASSCWTIEHFRLSSSIRCPKGDVESNAGFAWTAYRTYIIIRKKNAVTKTENFFISYGQHVNWDIKS